jgi:hypothetical protein
MRIAGLVGLEKQISHKSSQIEISWHNSHFFQFLEDSERIPLTAQVPFRDPFDDPEEEPEYQPRFNWDRDVVPLLDSLPPRIADIVELRHQGVGEYIIANMFEVSQSAICYILQRAHERLRFLYNRPKYTDEQLERLLSLCLTAPKVIRLMIKLWNDPNQTKAVGEEFQTQTTVRKIFHNSIEVLRESCQAFPEILPIYLHFKNVKDNKLYSILVNPTHSLEHNSMIRKTVLENRSLTAEERAAKVEERQAKAAHAQRVKRLAAARLRRAAKKKAWEIEYREKNEARKAQEAAKEQATREKIQERLAKAADRRKALQDALVEEMVNHRDQVD